MTEPQNKHEFPLDPHQLRRQPREAATVGPRRTTKPFSGCVSSRTRKFMFRRASELDDDGSGRAMTTTADACSIQSASPIFGFWPNDAGAYAIAVISAIGHVFASGLETWCAGGPDLTRLVNQARAENP